MTQKPVFRTHKTWQDYLGMTLGIAITLSPWFREEGLAGAVYANAAIVGIALLLLAQFELIRSRRWEELAELACGVWIIISPFAFRYAAHGETRGWHWLLGTIVVALAALEYRQRKDV